MSQLISILAVTFPIFALVLGGYAATRRGVLQVAAIPGLTGYILSFALPALLFRMGMGTPLDQLLDGPLLGVYLVCALALSGLTLLFSRNSRIGLRDAAFGGLVSIYPNAGFMGIPLLAALLGDLSARVVILSVLVDCFLNISLCLAVVQLPEGKCRTGVLRTLVRAFLAAMRGALSNPLPWPIAAGVLFGVSGLAMPEPVGKLISMLADTASPVALFTIGAILARSAVGTGQANPPIDYVPVALAKLLVHPSLVYLTGRAVQWSGFALDETALITLTLVAALPPAVNVTMLAERFGADSGRIARIIMVATSLSFITFTAAVWLLGVKPPGA